MEPQKIPSAVPDGNTPKPQDMAAGAPPLQDEAEAPVATDTSPTSASPDMAASTDSNAADSPAPSQDDTSPILGPVPSMEMDDMPTPLPVGTPKARKKGLMIGLILAAGVFVLAGGVAAAYYYVANKPENILKRALANTLDETKVKTVQFSGELTSAGKGSDMTFGATYKGMADNQTGAFDISANVDAVVTKVSLDMRSPDGKSYYLKLGGLKGLPELMGGRGAGDYAAIYASLLAAVNDQWIEINDSLVKSASGGSLKSDKLSAADRTKLLQAYKQHAFLVVKESLPAEQIKGVNSYHFTVAADKTKLRDFVAALKTAQIASFKLTDAQIKDFNKSLEQSKLDKYPVDVWVAKSTKMINQVAIKTTQGATTVNVRFTVDSYNQPVKVEKPAGAKSLLDLLGGFYSGQAGGSPQSLMSGIAL